MCYNPIHLWQMGWARPAGHLDATNMLPGVWYSSSLSDQTASATGSSVRIATSWANAATSPAMQYHVSYR